jgi:hypothetical protein
MALTKSRPSQLLMHLRVEALPSLIEMARWQDLGHAYAYKVILGRIARFDDACIEQLIQRGKVDDLVAAAENQS